MITVRPVAVARLPIPAEPDFRPGSAPLTVTARPMPAGAVVIAVRGEVDLLTGRLLLDGLLSQVRPTVRLLVVDLTAVTFFGASGLTALLTARQAAVAAGAGMRVAAHSRPVVLPLRITGLDVLFDVRPTVNHVLQRWGR